MELHQFKSGVGSKSAHLCHPYTVSMSWSAAMLKLLREWVISCSTVAEYALLPHCFYHEPWASGLVTTWHSLCTHVPLLSNSKEPPITVLTQAKLAFFSWTLKTRSSAGVNGNSWESAPNTTRFGPQPNPTSVEVNENLSIDGQHWIRPLIESKFCHNCIKQCIF